jgi:hypothetical protein
MKLNDHHTPANTHFCTKCTILFIYLQFQMGLSSAEEINDAENLQSIVVEKECKNFFGLQSCYPASFYMTKFYETSTSYPKCFSL